MKNAKWLKQYINSEEIKQIEGAIAEAEKTTTGEIIPMIVRRSSYGGFIPILSSALIMVISLFSLLLLEKMEIFDFPLWSVVLILLASVLAGRLLAMIPFFRRGLMSKIDRNHQVNLRAKLEFYETGIENTSEKTGILLFVSLQERRAVVLADKGIARELPSETWTDIVELLLDGVKRGNMADGFVKAIGQCGLILSKHFPVREGDVNELKNKLLIKE